MNDLIKDTYKNIIPPFLDGLGYYDKYLDSDTGQFLIPMYHRIISNKSSDPFRTGMCVSVDQLDKQLMYFSEKYRSISLSDFVSTQHDTKNSKYVSLTFDDGYKDFLTTAVPIIRKYRMHATLFICPSMLSGNKKYWWDVLAESIRLTKKSKLDLSKINVKGLDSVLSTMPNDKKNSLVYLVEKLWQLSGKKNDYIVSRIYEQLLTHSIDDVPSVLTEEEIVSLYKSGVEIGSHSVHHYNLSLLSQAEIIEELTKSKSIIEEITNDVVNGFAFPAGFKSPEITEFVKKSGYLYSVTTEKGFNYSQDNYALQRISMPDSSVSDMKRCLVDNLGN